MSPTVKRSALATAIGVFMGLVLSAVGFGDSAEVRQMMRLRDPRLHATFVCAAGLAAVLLTVFAPRARAHGKVLETRTLVGAALFGIGWGVCFTCPAGALVQLAAGQGPALVALIAIAAGIFLADACSRRFGWGRKSCDVE